jgi:hypothetical protein
VPRRRAPAGPGLDVSKLRVAFGGLVAVEDLSFSVPLGLAPLIVDQIFDFMERVSKEGGASSFDAPDGHRRLPGRPVLGMWMLLDEAEVLLSAGTCVVQQASSHGFSNRSPEYCVFAAVLVDAAAPGGMPS